MKIHFLALLLTALVALGNESWTFFPVSSKVQWHRVPLTEITPETAEVFGAKPKKVELKNGYFHNAAADAAIGVLTRRFTAEAGTRYFNVGASGTYWEISLNGKRVARRKTSGFEVQAPLPGDSLVALELAAGENLLTIQFSGVKRPDDKQDLTLYFAPVTKAQFDAEAPTRENFAAIAEGKIPTYRAARIIQHGVENMTSTCFNSFNSRPDIPEAELEKIYAEHPLLEFYDGVIDRLKREVPAENVKSGATCWLLYNMGYIIKTPQATFGIDLSHRRAAELADLLDFVLVTHNHADHYSLPLMQEMARRGKPVISNFFPAPGYLRPPANYKNRDVLIQAYETDHNSKLRKFISAYRITCGEGDSAPVIYHSGDSCDHRQQPEGLPIDVHILHPVVGMSVPDVAKRLRPREIWFSHLWEMGHCPPSKYRPVAVGDFRIRGAATVNATPGVVLRMPLWGEKIHLESARANATELEKIDRNFQGEVVGGQVWKFSPATAAPFQIDGLPWRDKPFFRLPGNFTEKEINAGALNLAKHTSGAVVRFASDSPRIAVKAKLRNSSFMPHMTPVGSAGFDLYARTRGGDYQFVGIARVRPFEQSISAVVANLGSAEPREFILDLPLYGGVESLEIGVAPDATVSAPPPYQVPHPVLFYGSSITQGGCASRPGNSYSHMLTRAVDAEEINLGFSGSGMGEIAVAKAIAELKLSCLVLDYDHNAPNVEHLRTTHEPFFLAIREKQPDLPIILMSRCDFYGTPDNLARREVVKQTYDRAIARGDKNVYFIDGETLFGTQDRDACTVDRTHPNDLGFYRMYQTILPVLKKALKLR